MAKLIHRIGAKHIKFDLEVEIHYLKLDLPGPTQIKIRVKRGKDKVEETQVMQYSPKLKSVQFDYPLNFRITMYKKSNKYSKKDLSIKVIEFKGTSDIIIASTKIEFHKIAETNRNIISEELPLQDCIDKKAKICLTVKLFEEGKPRINEFMTQIPGSMQVSNNRRALSFYEPVDFSSDFAPERKGSLKPFKPVNYEEPADIQWRKNKKKDSQSLMETYEFDTDEQVIQPKDPKASIKNLRSAFCIPQELIEEFQDKEAPIENSVEIEQEKKKEILIIDDHLESNSKPKNYSDLKQHNDENVIKVTQTKDSPIAFTPTMTPEKNNDLDSPRENEIALARSEVFTPQESPEKVKNDQKSEEIIEIKVADTLGGPDIQTAAKPEYLKYANHDILENIFEKDFEDSSSSEEVPEEVEVTAESQAPISNLKDSLPNASSQGLQLDLKEREAGLPESRDSTCCASCIVF